MKFKIEKKVTIELEMGDVLITNEKLPTTLKEMLAANDEEIFVYADSIEEAKSLVERYSTNKIYVVEEAGGYYGDSEYFDKHVKFLSFSNGEYYLKEKGKEAQKVA